MNRLREEYLVIEDPCTSNACYCKNKCNNCDKCKLFCGKIELFSIKQLREYILDYFGDQLVVHSKKIEGYRVELKNNDILRNYLDIVNSMILSERYNDKYLECDNLFELLRLKVMKIIGVIRTGYEIERTDTSNLQSWILKNPLCIGLEYWEKALYDIPYLFNINVEQITETTKEIVLKVMSLDKPKRDIVFEVIKEEKLFNNEKEFKLKTINIESVNNEQLDVSVDVELVKKNDGYLSIGVEGEEVLIREKELLIISKIID